MTRSSFVALFTLAAALPLVACRSERAPAPAASASASASVGAPLMWIDEARLIWHGGDEPTDLDLTALDEGRAPDAGKPTDKIARTVILTGRFSEEGEQLPPAVADRVLKTMRIRAQGSPTAVLIRMFRDDIAPDAAMGTIVIVQDPSAPIDWASVQPKDLGRLLPENPRPTVQKTSIALTRSFARSWRAWTTGYAETWDGKPLAADAAITLCEHAIALEMAPGAVLPSAEERKKDCAAPKVGAQLLSWSCFYTWESKKEHYACAAEPTKAPTITIAPVPPPKPSK